MVRRALDVLVIWKELLGVSVLSLRHAHQRAGYCPAQLAQKFRGCPKLGLKAQDPICFA